MVLMACHKRSALEQNNQIDSPVVTENTKPVSLVDFFAIGDIGFGSSELDVTAKMGIPISVEKLVYDCNEIEVCEYWNYDHAWFFMSQGEVWGLSSQSTDMCLMNKICIGESVTNIFTYLGETEIVPASSDKPRRLFYDSKYNETCWLWIFLDIEDKAQEFRLACQP